jgi:hypothetical protein
VDRLAAGLGWPLPFVLLAAGLITAFTAGGMAVLTWWWSRGNALGDQLREYGALTGQSRAIAEDLADQSRGYARFSCETTDEAHRELNLGEQAMHSGYHTVGVGLQKAARILDQETVLTPSPSNLFVIGRPVRDRTIANIGRAETILAEVRQTLAGAPPFDPASPHPNPWAARSAPRRGRANPAFVDPHQLGALHTPEPGPTPLWRRPWVLGTACVAVLTLAALAAVTLLIIG